jgi:MFS family permease
VSARRPVLVLLSMSVMSALIWMPTSEVPVALPHIHRDLGASFTDLQWMVNAYTLAVAALLVVMGPDRRPVRPPGWMSADAYLGP